MLVVVIDAASAPPPSPRPSRPRGTGHARPRSGRSGDRRRHRGPRWPAAAPGRVDAVPGRQVDLAPGAAAGRPGRGHPGSPGSPTATTWRGPGWPWRPWGPGSTGSRAPSVTVAGAVHRLTAPAGAGRPRELGDGDAPAGRSGGRRPRGHPTDRGRLAAVPTDGPGGRTPAARWGRPCTGWGAVPAPAGRDRRAPGGSTTPRRWPAPRSRGPSCWPGSTPTARPWSVSRWPPGPTPRRCWPSPGPRSTSSRGARAGWSGSGASTLRPVDRDVPGDPSQAAFWVVAGVVVPGERGDGGRACTSGPSAPVSSTCWRAWGPTSGAGRGRRPPSDATAAPRPSAAPTVEAAEIPSLDEVPILAVAALVAEGTTRFRDVGELRVKESDRLAGDGAAWSGPSGCGPGRGRRPGRRRRGRADAGRGGRRGGPPDGHGRRRGRGRLCRAGRPRITGWEAVATSYPGFADDPRRAWDRGPRGPRA